MSGWDQHADIFDDLTPRDRRVIVIGLVAALLVILAAGLGWIDADDTQQRQPAPEGLWLSPAAFTPTAPTTVPAPVGRVPADRVDNAVQVTDTIPPPPTTVPTGINGLPFAPAGLTGCDEMSWYRTQAGLPDHFDTVGYRESRCRNDVSSFCCHGYWQLYVSLHVRDHRLGPRYAACGITSVDDVLGDDPLDKQRNACGARAVYDISGGGAWDTW